MKDNLREVIENAERNIELKREYRAAREEGKDKAVLDKIREEGLALGEYIDSWDDNWSFMYQLVHHQLETENEEVDFWDLHDENAAESAIAILKMFGVEKFTFSSTWSSAINVAWKFTTLGCKLVGMKQIRGRYKEIMFDEYEIVPAYVFEIG